LVSRQDLVEDIYIHSGVTLEEQRRIYAEAVITVFPATLDAWAPQIVESLAMGTPVVAAKIPCAQEAAGGFATWFDPADPNDIARAIAEALGDPESFANQRAAAHRHAARFTWANTAAQTVAVYRELMG
jgi:glycosyltransferase involved in cell wall biosynthesis